MLFSRFISILCLILSFTSFSFSSPKYTENVDFNSILVNWNSLLKEYVHKGTVSGIKTTLVDYKKLKEDNRFESLITKLESFDIKSLDTTTDKLAFWINVYNISCIKVVLENYPVKSIKDIGSLLSTVWNSSLIKVGNLNFSLYEIEHHILRELKDPRIHAAIVCASLSCPDLKPYAYAPTAISKQLDKSLKDFLNNTTKGLKKDRKNKVVTISKIFKWFKKDFKRSGGVEYVIATHIKVRNSKEYKLSYLTYNWNLNDYTDD
ncbi:DUF547 domain-containing protein [Candidatus Marinamargulisbacteria bacterium SCGC AAA071-K20]|nr:DUF547 domain-containing protein [Candidatus Marinamargulisbacteria bacterium SCGC AAA071-K20]